MTKPTTIEITNFTGRLTRIINGDLNSGFANFDKSWGYDPFSKPMNLTWNYQPDDIAGTVITDAVFASKTISPTANEEYVYAIGSTARLYRIDPTNSGSGNTPLNDSPSLIGSLGSIVGSMNYGSDLDYYLSRLYFTSDNSINSATLAGASPTSVFGSGSSVVGGVYHGLVQFVGNLYFGNGNNIGEITSGGIITTGTKLSPGLPVGMIVRDLDVTPDGIYMIITASYVYPDRMDTPTSGGRVQSYASESYKFYWNGTDVGVTSFEALPSFPATNLTTFLDKQFTFNQDTFGTALFEGSQKLLTLPNNLTPMPNGSAPNGTFLTWVSPEGTGNPNASDPSYLETYTSLYYYGQLDQENSPGLWRMMRKLPTTNSVAYRAPNNQLVNSFSLNLAQVSGWGKHYISVWEYNTGSSTSNYHFFRFLLQPTALTTPVNGVYQTQTQLFSKRVGLTQIRVYTEPTVANNSFELEIIGSDGTIVDNGTFDYAYTAGTDVTKLQGSLERINFNPNTKTLYAIGIRIINIGSANMTIKKIELDIAQEGK